MLADLSLGPRARAGLTIAIVALAVALNPLNAQMRVWLRDDVVGSVPFWLDHLLFMVTLMVVVWGLIGFLLLSPRELGLGLPERPREGWLVALGSAVALIALTVAVLWALGALEMAPNPNWPVLFANFASNFYEEFIYRGAILGLLAKVLGRQHAWLAALLSAALFCQGHLHYPPVLVAIVFVGGLTWAAMTLRYQSLWPAWASHTLADTIGALFGL